MKVSRRDASVALALMALAAAGAQAWRPRIHLTDLRPKLDLAVLFPREFGAWRVDDRTPAQLVSPDQQAMLNRLYNQTLSRVYVNGTGERVMLSVAYGGDQSDATRAHRPEVCYPAQGFELVGDRVDTLDLGGQTTPVRQVVTRLGGRVEPVVYWIVVGDYVALSGTQQKLAQLRYSSRGIIPDGMLVRTSTIDPQVERSFAVQRSFLRDMSASLPADRRARIFGGRA